MVEYDGDYIFAFDNIVDYELDEKDTAVTTVSLSSIYNEI